MKAPIFFGYFIMLLIGVAIGGKVANLAYKPILIAQALEIYQMEDDNKQIQKRFELLKVEIEAHKQDMGQFIDKSELAKVLKQLGILK